MNEAEKLLEKFARKNMIEWNQESFKRTHSILHKSIIEAINEALNLHNVVGQSEQLKAFQKMVNKTKGYVAISDELIDKHLKSL